MTSNFSTHLNPFLLVDINTPYLTRSFDDLVRERGQEYADKQVAKYGQEIITLSGVKTLTSLGGKVVLLKTERMDGKDIVQHEECRIAVPDMYITGAVEGIEEVVSGVRDSGLLFARFSIFYGGPSKYTGRTAQEAGYSFDIPKSVDTVRKFLTNDSCLEAIASRNASSVRRSLDKLNESLPKPILATPHLEVALARPQARIMLT